MVKSSDKLIHYKQCKSALKKLPFAEVRANWVHFHLHLPAQLTEEVIYVLP